MSDAMLYPVVDKYHWANRYSLQIKSRPCRKCGELLTTNIPFASGEWRGLTSEPHECGEGYDIFVATKPDRTELIEMFNNLSDRISEA